MVAVVSIDLFCSQIVFFKGKYKRRTSSIKTSVRDKGWSVIDGWALKIKIVGGGGGRNQLDHQFYTPLYKKGIKKMENKSMETTLAEWRSENMQDMHPIWETKYSFFIVTALRCSIDLLSVKLWLHFVLINQCKASYKCAHSRMVQANPLACHRIWWLAKRPQVSTTKQIISTFNLLILKWISSEL